MLRFLYTGQVFDYQTVAPQKPMTLELVRSMMISLVTLYSLGDKYGIPTLCRYTKTYFEKITKYTHKVEDLLYCVPEIYHGTPESDRGLRDAVVRQFLTMCRGVAQKGEPRDCLFQLSDDIKQFRDDIISALILAAQGRSW